MLAREQVPYLQATVNDASVAPSAKSIKPTNQIVALWKAEPFAARQYDERPRRPGSPSDAHLIRLARELSFDATRLSFDGDFVRSALAWGRPLPDLRGSLYEKCGKVLASAFSWLTARQLHGKPKTTPRHVVRRPGVALANEATLIARWSSRAAR